jgi:c-di-GMP-binding flagellar brake protein YcgR
MMLIMEIIAILALFATLILLVKNEKVSSKTNAQVAKIEECWDGTERRRHVRFKKTLDVTYSVRKRSISENGRTVDVSEGGAKLILEEKFSKGTIIHMQIPLPELKKTVAVEAEVVWSKEADAIPVTDDKRYFQCGVKFLAIKEPPGVSFIKYIDMSSEPAMATAY